MSQKLTILFTPVEAHGHINSCVGVAQALHERGHRIIFTIGPAWKGKLKKYGFEEVEVYRNGKDNVGDNEFWTDRIKMKCKSLSSGSAMDVLEYFWVPEITEIMVAFMEYGDGQNKAIIDSFKPDLIVNDNYIISPAIVNSGIPWVWLASVNPLYVIDDKRTPPTMSGLSSYGNKEEWETSRQKCNDLFAPLVEKTNEWLANIHSMPPSIHGAPANLHPPSPYANIYMMPEEIDYLDLRPLPEKWFRFDNFMRKEDNENGRTFEMPQCLNGKSGKLIYVSMGTIGCADLSLMHRLVDILSKSKHRFIISKGPLADKYELAENMWGENMLPQTKIIPICDLVITHGGNNTVTESFYFGKPMIVMPIFVDQFDNAQRIEDKGYGLRMNPYYCTQDELLNGINQLVDDKRLAEKMFSISKRIQQARSVEKVADLLEKVAFKK